MKGGQGGGEGSSYPGPGTPCGPRGKWGNRQNDSGLKEFQKSWTLNEEP